MKKKLLLLSVLSALALSLYGCDSKDSDDSDKESVKTEASVDDEAEATEATTEADVAEETVPAQRGTVTDGVFTNEVFKVSFPLNSDWYVCSDEELAEIAGMATDEAANISNMTAEEFEAATSGILYDMVFFFSDLTSNTQVSYINLSGGEDISTETYAKATISQLENMAGVTYTIGELTTENYGGDDWTCINAQTDQGFDQKMLLKKVNGYMACITITYTPDVADEAQAYLDSLNPVR